jgi:hypothetical protein
MWRWFSWWPKAHAPSPPHCMGEERTATPSDDGFDDALGDSIRWSLHEAVGRDQPPATVWLRIEAELRRPSRSWMTRVERFSWTLPDALRSVRLDLAYALQMSLVLAVLVFLATTAFELAPGWWGLPGVRSTPVAVIDPVLVDAAVPESLSGLYWAQLERGQTKWYDQRVARVSADSVSRLSRIEDAARVYLVDSAGEATQLDVASLETQAWRHVLASLPRDIPPSVSLFDVSQPVVLASPDGPGLIR